MPAEAAGAAQLAVEVVWAAGPQAVEVVNLLLPAGATVGEALAASGLLARHGLTPSAEPGAAVLITRWGRPCAADAPLRDRDRIELLRPLTVDPKEARRQRYRGQGGQSGSEGRRSRRGSTPG